MKPRIPVAVLGFLLLLANSSYLYAFATPSLFYFANVALHVLLGAVLTVVLLLALRHHLRDGLFFTAAAPVLLVGAGFGFYIAVVGATRAHVPALHWHIGIAAAGAALLLLHLMGSGLAFGAGRPNPRFLAGFAVIVFAFPLALRWYEQSQPPRDRIENPTSVALSMEGEGAGPKSPFFPSSAETNVGGIIPSNFFMTSQACGRCHKEIYKQWSSSAHHFSSFNNQWYRKSIEYMQDVQGTTQGSKWCAGCHDHAVFFNGRFERPIKEQIQTPEAQAGLSCTSCHAIVHVKSTMGQGDFTIEYPPLHDLAASENEVAQWVHDRLLVMDPEPHKKTFIKSFHREQSPEFCASCHKVHLDVPVNNYRWFRGFNEYDNWQASGVSGQGARSFYYPAKPMKCASCHMPLIEAEDPAATEGKVHSHRFPGANTALPHVNKDPVQLKVVQDFLRDGQISVDVFGLVRTAATATSKPAPGAPARNEPELATSFAQGEESGTLAGGAFLLPPAEVILSLIHI